MRDINSHAISIPADTEKSNDLPKEVDLDLKKWIEHYNAFEKIDLNKIPCDPKISNVIPIEICAQFGIIPWQKIANFTVVLVSDQASKTKIRHALAHMNTKIIFAFCEKPEIQRELLRLRSNELTQYAHKRSPPQFRLNTLKRSRIIALMAMFCAVILSVSQMGSMNLTAILLLVATFFIFVNSAVRLFAIILKLFEKSSENTPIALINNWPKISILVPLFKETGVVEKLVNALSELDYPKDKLDIKLLLEEVDQPTIDYISARELPSEISAFVVPKDHLQTKPKALNFALPFCEGEFVGIYDAEDVPNPSQLKDVVRCFHLEPEDTACVQCELDFFNQNQNWFTRCFTIEYRIWFHVLLPAIQRLGFAVPLGGTSLFVRKHILEEVGAWDAYNVTEDADLGIKLKRLGYETKVIKTATLEEANGRPISWIRQRSRWMKGYMVTWASHMRSPHKLMLDLGIRGYTGVQVMFLGALVNSMSLPLFWLSWLSVFGFDFIGYSQFNENGKLLIISVLLFSQIVSISLAAVTLLPDKQRRTLFKWYFTMPFYWPLSTIAVYKGLYEAAFKPFYWDKTEHGFCEDDSDNEKSNPKAPIQIQLPNIATGS